MNIYETLELENEIDLIAKNNDGEIPEDKMESLIVSQTNSLVQLEKLCKYIAYLEYFAESCKQEENRISSARRKAENRVESIKKWITPYVLSKGKVSAGTFSLTTRQSKGLIVKDESVIPENYFEHKIIEQKILNKSQLKKDIDSGSIIPGAMIEIRENLQIK